MKSVLNGGPHFSAGGQAFVCNFGPAHMIKRRRKETLFSLTMRDGYDKYLPTTADIPHMVSPLFDPSSWTIEKDTAPRAPLFLSPPGAAHSITPTESKWNIKNLRQAASDYPDRLVARIAFKGADGTFNPVVFDASKPVVWPDRHANPDEKKAVRANLIKLVEKGQAWGPLPYCPFPNARIYPPGLAKKHKYDPTNNEYRLISDISAGDEHSVNNLTVDPRLLYVCFTIQMFCNECCAAGHGTTFSQGDVPAAFKMNPQNPDLLPLFVTNIDTEEFGLEFFGDRCHCFGWRAAEYVFACQHAIVRWEFRRRCIALIFWMVDNYYHLHPPSLLGKNRIISTEAEVESTRATFLYLGIDIHKQSDGYKGPVLGWEVDLDFRGIEGPMVIIIPLVKYDFYLGRFSVWNGLSAMSLKDIESACGIAQHLSAGLPILKCFVLPLYRSTRDGKAKQSRLSAKHRVHDDKVILHIDPEVKNALYLIFKCIKIWNRVCPMIPQFGPRSLPEVYLWVDAGTGCTSLDAKFKSPPGWGAIMMSVGIDGVCTVRGCGAAFSSLECEGASGPLLELRVIKEALTRWIPSLHRKRVLLGNDCLPAMQAFVKGWSPVETMQKVIREAYITLLPQFMCLRLFHIPRSHPTIRICDLLGRGQSAAASELCSQTFGAPLITNA